MMDGGTCSTDLQKPQETKRKKVERFIRNNLLVLTTLVGVIFGIVAGAILRPYGFSTETILLISYPGELFMRILKLLTLPLLISSLINVSANLNLQMNGKIALRTIIYFALTSMFSTFLGNTTCFSILLSFSKKKRFS